MCGGKNHGNVFIQQTTNDWPVDNVHAWLALEPDSGDQIDCTGLETECVPAMDVLAKPRIQINFKSN